MTHRVEQIMQAVVTACTGLTTTGANVSRAFAYNTGTVPCLFINMGAEEKIGDYATGVNDWLLTFYVTAKVKTDSNLETSINTIRAEVHAALRTTAGLGLSFVQDIIEGNPQEIEISGDVEMPAAQQVFIWQARYRRNLDNPN